MNAQRRRFRGLRELTPREWEVVYHVGQARHFKEIGRRMDISEHTVHYHLANIYSKLGFHDHAQEWSYIVKLARFAWENDDDCRVSGLVTQLRTRDKRRSGAGGRRAPERRLAAA